MRNARRGTLLAIGLLVTMTGFLSVPAQSTQLTFDRVYRDAATYNGSGAASAGAEANNDGLLIARADAANTGLGSHARSTARAVAGGEKLLGSFTGGRWQIIATLSSARGTTTATKATNEAGAVAGQLALLKAMFNCTAGCADSRLVTNRRMFVGDAKWLPQTPSPTTLTVTVDVPDSWIGTITVATELHSYVMASGDASTQSQATADVLALTAYRL